MNAVYTIDVRRPNGTPGEPIRLGAEHVGPDGRLTASGMRLLREAVGAGATLYEKVVDEGAPDRGVRSLYGVLDKLQKPVQLPVGHLAALVRLEAVPTGMPPTLRSGRGVLRSGEAGAGPSRPPEEEASTVEGFAYKP